MDDTDLAVDLKTFARLFGPILLIGVLLIVNVIGHHDSYIARIPHVTADRPTVTAITTTTISARTTMWARLADCESGAWDRHRQPIPGSANWQDRRGGYEGGVHFAPGTWDDNRAPDMPGNAADAHVWAQVWVAERVLDRQGPGAWPVCSRKVGLR